MSSGKLFFSSSILSRTRSAVSMALASGRCEDGQAGVGLAVELAGRVQVLAPSSTRPTSLMRTLRPSSVGAQDDVRRTAPASASRPSGRDGQLVAAGRRRSAAGRCGRRRPAGSARAGRWPRRRPSGSAPPAFPDRPRCACCSLAGRTAGTSPTPSTRAISSLTLDGGEVAQVELVVAALGRVDGDDHAGCPGCACGW